MIPMKPLSQHPRLLRGLSLVDATSLTVGTIIGTGIFLKAAIMSQILGSSWLVLTAWLTAGLLSLAGALTYAEMGCLFPKAGGEYVYLREAYGDLPAFLFGWMRFWIGGPGSVAAFSVGSATFIAEVIALETVNARTTISVGLIFFFTALNCLSVALGGRIITIITAIKLLLIMSVPLGVVFFSETAQWANIANGTSTVFTWSGFGTAMIAALWAFDGWNNLPMMAGEVHKPEVNVPRALIFGTLIVLGVYSIVNLSYFYALPINEVATASSKLYPAAPPVAAKVVQTFLGPSGYLLFSILLVISAMGAMNGSVMSSSRVPYALAKDGLFPQFLSQVSASTHVPFVSLIIQGAMAALLALSGSFDQLTDYVVFASWIFYALVAYSIFIFRKKLPLAERAYKTIGYPVTPVIFISMASLLLVNTVLRSWQESLIGMLMIGSGIPAYYWFSRQRSH
jgi:APA family basic amino acid/polyamine antiporter